MDELLRTWAQVLLGAYIAYNATLRLNSINEKVSLSLAIGYVVMGAASFLLMLRPFALDLVVSWASLALMAGVALVTISYKKIWRDQDLVAYLNSHPLQIKSNTLTTKKGVLALMVVVSTIVFTLDWVFSILDGSPVQVTALEAKSPVIKEGENLVLTAVLNRKRSCPALIYDAIVSKTEIDAVYRLPVVSAGFSPIGYAKITRIIKTEGITFEGLPYKLTPGSYSYKSWSEHRCQDRVYTVVNDPIIFLVESSQ